MLGARTALFGSLTALFQFDIKRIIAFSTCSQLGYRCAAVGLNSFEAAFNHLTMHAYFKALLFLVAGLIIHKLNNEQDIQKRGGLYILYPLLYVASLIGSLSLCARFSRSGFYSKDYIIELAYAKCTVDLTVIYVRLYIASMLTRLYSIRRRYRVFYRKTNIHKSNFRKSRSHQLSINSILVLIVLSLASILLGYMFSELRHPSNLTFNNQIFYNAGTRKAQNPRLTATFNDVELAKPGVKKALALRYLVVTVVVATIFSEYRLAYWVYFKPQRTSIRLFFQRKEDSMP